MCDVSASPEQIAGAIPRAATGLAVDPIALEPADEVVITTLVDNVYDALLPGDERVARAPFSAGLAGKRGPRSLPMDPLVIDDQALVVHLRGKGPVVLTGCGHAGAINIIRHAQRLTAVSGLHAMLGGLHLGGPAFEPTIGPTVRALTDLAPALLVPGHYTGWRAQHALAAALPKSWVAGSSGSSFRLGAP